MTLSHLCCVILCISAVGCRSKSLAGRHDPTVARPSKIGEDQVVEPKPSLRRSEADTIKIVKAFLERAKKEPVLATYKVIMQGEITKVYVDFGTRLDENGQVTGFYPGGYCTVYVHPDGSIADVDYGL